MDDEAPESPPPPPKPSQTPSWVLLGFVIGALFIWSLPREKPAPVEAAKTTVVQLERPKATDIEAVFTDWGKYAVWENELTEVALWDVERKTYSICYEILRSGEYYYFRSIPALKRPVLTHGVPEQSPLLYTESERQRQEWLRAVK